MPDPLSRFFIGQTVFAYVSQDWRLCTIVAQTRTGLDRELLYELRPHDKGLQRFTWHRHDDQMRTLDEHATDALVQ